MRCLLLLQMLFSLIAVGCSDSVPYPTVAFAGGTDLSALESTGTAAEKTQVKHLLLKIQNLQPLSSDECKDIPLLANLKERPISNDLANAIARYQHFYGNGLFKSKRGEERIKGQLDFTGIFRDHSLHAIFLAWNDAPEFLRTLNNRLSKIGAKETPTMAETLEILVAIQKCPSPEVRSISLEIIARPRAYEDWEKSKVRDVRLMDTTARMIAPGHLFQILNDNCKKLPQDSAELLAQRLERLSNVLKDLHAVELSSGRDAARRRCLQTLTEEQDYWKSFEQFTPVADVAVTKTVLKLTDEAVTKRRDTHGIGNDAILKDMERRAVEDLEKEIEEEETNESSLDDEDRKLPRRTPTQRSKELRQELDELLNPPTPERAFFLNDVKDNFTPIVTFSGTDFSWAGFSRFGDENGYSNTYLLPYAYRIVEKSNSVRYVSDDAATIHMRQRLPISIAENQRFELSSDFWQYDTPHREGDAFLFDDLSFPQGVRREAGFCKKCGGAASIIVTEREFRPEYSLGLTGSAYNPLTGDSLREYGQVLTGVKEVVRRERQGCPECENGYDPKTSSIYDRENPVDEEFTHILKWIEQLSETRLPLEKCTIKTAREKISRACSGVTLEGIPNETTGREIDFPRVCSNRYPTAFDILNAIQVELNCDYVIGHNSVIFLNH